MKKTILILSTVMSVFVFNMCKKDLCANVTCQNGGSCANGTCNCATGYTGSDCSQQKTPTKITVTKITITKFPATDGSGAGWDLTSGADLFPTLYLGTTTVWDSPTDYTDASNSLTYDFTPSPSIDLTSPTSRYTIDAYDYDTPDPNDFMGGINFTPYSSTNNFPATLTIDAGGAVAFKLYVTYSF